MYAKSVLLGEECSRWFVVVAGLIWLCFFVTSSLQCIYDGNVEGFGGKKLEIEIKGIGQLLIADDSVLLARDQVELQMMLDVVGKYVMK